MFQKENNIERSKIEIVQNVESLVYIFGLFLLSWESDGSWNIEFFSHVLSFLLPFENQCKVNKDEFAFQTESILGLVGFSPFLCVIRSFYLLTTLHLWSSASHWITESNTFVCPKGITVKQGGLIGWVSLRYISSPNHLSRLQQRLLEQSSVN